MSGAASEPGLIFLKLRQIFHPIFSNQELKPLAALRIFSARLLVDTAPQ